MGNTNKVRPEPSFQCVKQTANLHLKDERNLAGFICYKGERELNISYSRQFSYFYQLFHGDCKQELCLKSLRDTQRHTQIALRLAQ